MTENILYQPSRLKDAHTTLRKTLCFKIVCRLNSFMAETRVTKRGRDRNGHGWEEAGTRECSAMAPVPAGERAHGDTGSVRLQRAERCQQMPGAA